MFDEDIAEVVVCRQRTERRRCRDGKWVVCACVCVLMMAGQREESSGMKTETDGMAAYVCMC